MGDYAKEDKVVATQPLPGVPVGETGVVIGLARPRGCAALRVDFGPRGTVDADVTILDHAPLVPGHRIKKGDRIVAKVAYEETEVGDAGVVVGPCDREMHARDCLRVCVLWERTKAKNNWQPGRHIELAPRPLLEKAHDGRRWTSKTWRGCCWTTAQVEHKRAVLHPVCLHPLSPTNADSEKTSPAMYAVDGGRAALKKAALEVQAGFRRPTSYRERRSLEKRRSTAGNLGIGVKGHVDLVAAYLFAAVSGDPNGSVTYCALFVTSWSSE